jgi:hypothetical protein
MNLTVRLLGAEVFHISTETGDDEAPGDCATMPMGFVASPGDQRWEKGLDLE